MPEAPLDGDEKAWNQGRQELGRLDAKDKSLVFSPVCKEVL